MSDPGRLSLSVTHADGRVTRWGPDEVDAARVLGRLRFATTIPGGNKDLTCGLLRHPNVTYNDQALFDTVRAYGPGNVTAWEGRMQQFPRTDGASFAINPGAVGWAAHMRDDPTFSMVYVDRDLSRWGPVSRARRIALLNANIVPNDPAVQPDRSNGLPALALELREPSAARQVAEALYDAGPGNRIAALYFNLDRHAITAPWETRLYSGDADDSLSNPSPDQVGPDGTTDTYYTPAAAHRYVMLQLDSHAATDTATHTAMWRSLAAYGNHGLPRRGADPGGLLASDIIGDIISRAAPLLRFTTGPGGSIEPTTFAVPHLVFADPGTAEDAVLAANIFDLFEWGVYDDREFFYRAPDPERLTWKVRRSDGAIFNHDGLSADEVFNGVYVRYQDPAGTTHTVGPPGSNAETTSALLADTSPENPVNAHGIPRRLARLDLSQTTTGAGAITIGAAVLAERALADRKGSLTVPDTAIHPTKGERPVWEMRAGDFVEIADHDDPAPRRMIETDYDHDVRTNNLSLDSTVHKLDAILERLGADLVSIL